MNIYKETIEIIYYICSSLGLMAAAYWWFYKQYKRLPEETKRNTKEKILIILTFCVFIFQSSFSMYKASLFYNKNPYFFCGWMSLAFFSISLAFSFFLFLKLLKLITAIMSSNGILEILRRMICKINNLPCSSNIKDDSNKEE